MGIGVYEDKRLKKLISDRIIQSKEKITEEQIQPSSLDLTLGEIGYATPFSFLPPKEDLEKYLKSIGSKKIDFSKKQLIRKNRGYIIELNESLNLPEFLQARSSPKSSTGRTDIHVRLLTENGSFDDVTPGYKGKLWIEIYSNSFDIEIQKGVSLNQLRIFDLHTKKLTNNELDLIHWKNGLSYEGNQKISRDKLKSFLEKSSVSFNLGLDKKNPGYIARRDAPCVDLTKTNHPASKYFNKINLNDEGIIISKGDFYILASSQEIAIPQGYCAEMADIKTEAGEFRAHYAGFFDPGFKAQGVLEVRNLGHDFLLRNKQKIGSLEFFPMKNNSEKVYGITLKSNYQGQKGPKLAKFFDDTLLTANSLTL
jgi:dCTP deaminase